MTDTEPAFPARAGKRSLREWCVRLGIVFIAIMVVQFGVTLFFLPALGSDPFTIFVQGWAKVFGLSVGRSHLCTVVFILCCILVFQRRYILPGTFVCAFTAGPAMDVYVRILEGAVSAGASMPVRLGAVVAGTLITAFGLSFLIKVDSGMGANDLIAVIMADRIPMQFRWARVSTDTFFALVGFCFGGVLGVGTPVSVLCVGPATQFFFPLAERVVAGVLAALAGPGKDAFHDAH